jgi:hypothetical protein
MTDIYGNPTPSYVYVPVYPYVPAPCTPFVKLGADFFDSAVFLLYAIVALLYVFGLLIALPRTACHDALVAAGVLPSLIAGPYWPSVRHIPAVGQAIYYLPVLALAMLPFAFDFYLMFGR